MQKVRDSIIPLKTRWSLQSEILPEYPRPTMERDEYLSLNGIWQYAINQDRMRPANFDGDIIVPFSPETKLSGVERQLLKGFYLWYERAFQLTQDMLQKLINKGHLLLHFGAVDQTCVVWINGKKVGSHQGGYLPFSFDITDEIELSIEKKQIITLRVEDVTDTSYHSIGKQTLTPGGMYYGGTSGIWQTVFLEVVPAVYIEEIYFNCLYRENRSELCMTLAGESSYMVEISFLNKEYPALVVPYQEKIILDMKDFISWSPENPYLYRVSIRLLDASGDRIDEVKSYFAMRICELGTDESGTRRIYLNGKPYLQIGVLDQGYWPESMYTAPTDEAMIYDIQTMKDLGFNMLRKHVKVEPERWYYHCDRLGMLVWQDMVNGGRKNKSFYVTYLATAFLLLGIKPSDRHPILLSRQDKKGKQEYFSELTQLVEQMKRYPSVVCIVPFNEGWGQFSTDKVTNYIRQKNPGILIDQASGWFDRKGGDFKSIHNYFFKLKLKREAYRAIALSEFGGYALRIEGHTLYQAEYGYRVYHTKDELQKGYEELFLDTIIPGIRDGISALVYTQLSDVEEEINGILTYDREVIKIPPEVLRRCNEKCRKEIEK